jgi:putative PIN family toxin of toxin-antitoxin system
MRNNKKYNVIIDTNVIVSALLTNNTDSSTFKVLKLFFDNEIVLYYSAQIMNEYFEVLSRKKFNFDENLIESIREAIEKFGIEITPENKDILMIDIKDKPFYELVMDEQIDDAKLVTGNIKHFPIQTNIMTPSQFMEMYNKNM